MSDGDLRTTYELNQRVSIATAIAGELAPLAGFVCQPGGRQYLHPLHGPAGGPVLTQDRPTDHPWQHGVFTALHAVNGLDFWTEHRTPAPERGTIHFERLTDLAGDSDSVGWRAQAAWLGPRGERHLTETQAFTVRRPGAGFYTIDLVWTLRAARDVAIGRYDYGGLAVRPIFHAEREHVNANGQRGADTSEKRAAWCDVTAPYDGSRAWTADDKLAGTWHGIALFDHPQNPTYPTPWRVDGHGLINPSPSLAGDWSIAEGEETSFVYRLVVHAGRADPDALDHLHEQFAEEGVPTAED
jgi:hypothetical protein